jgi:hypothetical protein
MDLDEARVAAYQTIRGEAVMTLEDAAQYARRIAYRMWRDPEGQSIANYSAWYAYRSYNGGIPLERWIAACVKRNIWHYWRKLKIRKAELKENAWMAEEVRMIETDEPDLVPYDVFELLYRKHVERWCVDVIARRYGWTMRETRTKLEEAAQLLQRAYAER